MKIVRTYLNKRQKKNDKNKKKISMKKEVFFFLEANFIRMFQTLDLIINYQSILKNKFNKLKT